MSVESAFDEEELDALAAEYVLGLTPPEAQAEVKLRLKRDPEFASSIAAWQERLVRLADDIKPQKPPRTLKQELTQSLFGQGRARSAASVFGWQFLSFAALAAAVFISVTDLKVMPASQLQVFATTLENEAEGLRLIAIFDPLRSEIAVGLIEGVTRSGRSLQLWAIAPNATPVSLGLVSSTGPTRLAIPDNLSAQLNDLTFMLSDEPSGGASAGVPTGEILAASGMSSF